MNAFLMNTLIVDADKFLNLKFSDRIFLNSKLRIYLTEGESYILDYNGGVRISIYEFKNLVREKAFAWGVLPMHEPSQSLNYFCNSVVFDNVTVELFINNSKLFDQLNLDVIIMVNDLKNIGNYSIFFNKNNEKDKILMDEDSFVKYFNGL